MPLDVLLVFLVVLLVTLTAFAVGAAIGVVMGRLGLDELDDTPGARPATQGRRSQG